MRRVPFKILLLVVVAVAVWGTLLMSSTSNNATVLTVERHMNKNQNDLKSRDCYITGLTKEKKHVAGYAPSSFCTSVKKGDTVVIEDGYVVRK